MKKQLLKLFLPLTISLILAIFIVASDTGHYVFALMLESRWSKSDPQTKDELEQHIFCYKTRVIQPSESMWGNSYKLKDGERVVQYCILWDENCPLDVVYDSEDNIKAIFTSYE